MATEQSELKTFEEVRKQFNDAGISISAWARDNNFSPDLVYRLFRNEKIPRRGESHRIAVKLGLKKNVQFGE